ncbi:MAG: 4Fe-4S binding protein [Thiotrichales bacterium]
MLEDLIAEARETLRLPEIDGDRCVHSIIESGSCEACVSACPTSAWIINDELVGIRPDLCDGCGICAAVCPEAAIVHDLKPHPGFWQGKMVAMLACERTAVAVPEEHIVPCMHALGTSDLLWLYRQGCRHIFTLSGDCSSCDRKDYGDALEVSISRINKMLMGHGLSMISHKPIPASRWLGVLGKLDFSHLFPPVSRRNFFRFAAAEIVKQGMNRTGIASTQEAFKPPGSILVFNNPSAGILPSYPVIDTALCNGCNACIQACPHDVITLKNEERAQDVAFYELKVEQCTGCNICVDICPEQALDIKRWQRPQETRITLRLSRCECCGVEIIRPAAMREEELRCHICERTGHYKNLYQTID